MRKAGPSRCLYDIGRAEREEISRGIAAGDSVRTIATALKRAPFLMVCSRFGRFGLEYEIAKEWDRRLRNDSITSRREVDVEPEVEAFLLR